MPFFLTRPAASDSDTATTARAFEGGADAEATSDAQRQKLAAEAQANEQDAASKLAIKQEEGRQKTAAERAKAVGEASETSYKEADQSLTNTINTTDAEVNNDDASQATQQAAAQARAAAVARQTALRSAHAKAGGAPVDYTQYGTGVAVPDVQLSPQAQAVNRAVDLKTVQEGVEAQAKLAGGATPGKNPKATQSAINALSDVSAHQNSIEDMAQYLVKLRNANPGKIDVATGKVADPDLNIEYLKTQAAFDGAQRQYQASYAKNIREIQNGGFGPEQQAALADVAKELPKGASITDPANYATIKQAIDARMKPFVGQKTVSNATKAYLSRYNALSDALPERDPASVLNAAKFSLATTKSENRPGPGSTRPGAPPPDGGASGSTGGSASGIGANPAGGNSTGFSGSTGAPTLPYDGGDQR